MSESKYEHDVCPFCELPMAKDEQEAEYQHRLKLVGYDEKNPDLVKWEDQYCWQGWDHAGTATEDRLVEVLEQRDALRTALSHFANRQNWRNVMGDTVFLGGSMPWDTAKAALNAAGGEHHD